MYIDAGRALLAVACAYFLGSIPFSHVATRWRTGLNVREVGIGNAGARNVWHVVGPRWGVLVALLDGAKGLAAVLLARALRTGALGLLLVGPVVLLGHAFPLFARFKGGKGLSTLIGVLLAWAPWPILTSLAILGVAQLLLRNFDRSIILGAAGAVFVPLAFGYPWTLSAYALLLFCLMWARKLQDRPHQQRIWSSSGWHDVDHSDWYGDSRGSDGEKEGNAPNGRGA